MIIKHINAKASDNSLVYLAQNTRGTILYDYVKEVFLFVQGFTIIGPHRCVYELDTVQEVHTLYEAYHLLYPEEDNK